MKMHFKSGIEPVSEKLMTMMKKKTNEYIGIDSNEFIFAKPKVIESKYLSIHIFFSSFLFGQLIF